MADFITLKNLISAKLNEDYLSTQVGDQINSTIRYLSRLHFWFNESVTTIPLVVGNPVVPSLPTDFFFEVPNGGLTINYSNSRFTLTKITPIEYNFRNNEGLGLPKFYTERNGELQVYFFPDVNYNLELRYIKSYPDLVNDNDTNDWSNNAERLIEYRTLADMYLDYRKDDQMFAIYNGRYEQELLQLKKMNNNRLGSNSLLTENINFNEGDRSWLL